MKLLVDGMMSGTGIRDARAGGYLDLASLDLSKSTQDRIEIWRAEYADSFVSGHPSDRVKELDQKGLAIADLVSQELLDADVGYFSDGLMKRIRRAP